MTDQREGSPFGENDPSRWRACRICAVPLSDYGRWCTPCRGAWDAAHLRMDDIVGWLREDWFHASPDDTPDTLDAVDAIRYRIREGLSHDDGGRSDGSPAAGSGGAGNDANRGSGREPHDAPPAPSICATCGNQYHDISRCEEQEWCGACDPEEQN